MIVTVALCGISISSFAGDTNNQTSSNKQSEVQRESVYTNRGKIIQAHQFDEKHGSVRVEHIQASDGTSIGYIDSGDWVKYSNIDFGNGENDIFMAMIAATDDCVSKNVEIRVDSPTGNLIGTLPIQVTGSWSLF